ncbi:hypothetical protein ACVWXM_003439 [Bradyrhizobium sp. GM7.3]
MSAGVAVLAGEFAPFRERVRVGPGDRREGQDVQDDPDRLRPELEAADQRDAVGDKRDDRDRADEIADRARNAEAHLERRGQDHRFDREEDEGEGGVDQRRDGRADITEAGAAGEQVNVDAAFGGIIGNRDAAAEDDDGDDEDRGGGVGNPVIQGDGAADRLKREKGDGAQGSVGDAGSGPPARALGGEAQRVVFQRLVGDPLVVLAPDAIYSLPPCHFSPHSYSRTRRTPSQNPYQKPTSSFCGAVYAILRMLAVHKFEPSSRHQSRVLEQQWGAHVRRSEQGPCYRRSGANY